jgi:hypothetical protein
MSLEQALAVLTWSIWIIFLVAVILYLWRTARTRGMAMALRRLFSLRPVLPFLLIAVAITLIYRSVVLSSRNGLGWSSRSPRRVGIATAPCAPG